MPSTRWTLAASLLFVLAAVPPAAPDKWTPYRFRATERYEFKTETHDGEKLVAGGYVLEFKPTERKDAQGQPLIEVSVTTRSYCAKDALESDPAGQVWGHQAMGMSMMTLNPMFSAYFQQVDLAVGEKMSLFGAGTVKVTAKETIAGREGFVCQYLQSDGSKEQLIAEYVIDPALALPLRSKIMADGGVQSSMELTAYTGK